MGGGYVDEFAVQFDHYGDPWWILQDANFNVLAMTDADGDVVREPRTSHEVTGARARRYAGRIPLYSPCTRSDSCFRTVSRTRRGMRQ